MTKKQYILLWMAGMLVGMVLYLQAENYFPKNFDNKYYDFTSGYVQEEDMGVVKSTRPIYLPKYLSYTNDYVVTVEGGYQICLFGRNNGMELLEQGEHLIQEAPCLFLVVPNNNNNKEIKLGQITIRKKGGIFYSRYQINEVSENRGVKIKYRLKLDAAEVIKGCKALDIL